MQLRAFAPIFAAMVRMLMHSFRALALKIASYGVMHLIVAILVALAITRDWRIALAIGLIEPVVQTIAYAIHDRAWHRIERRRMRSSVEETAEAVTARLDLMDAREQQRAHGHGPLYHHGHSHALPTSLKQIALKTLSYGVMHFAVAVGVAFVLTGGNLALALAIGLIEPLVQTVFFTVHDRIWARIEARRARRLAAA
ncbi:MAG: DUF2061 domain-containing protein [Brevundimonas sp.]|uniref:DUF2061 domain-containing protein n=1 Tax=Brevundimonas sp. TaxID=1871086 RepID=UPI0039189152